MGNCGMIAGAFSSTSGKADITLTTNGDVLYYNSGRQRLAIGDEGKVLTVSDADLPAWETAGGGKLELLDTHTASGTESTYTFTPASSLNLKTDYQQIIVEFGGRMTASLALQFVVNGDTSGYVTIKTFNDSGTLSGSLLTGQTSHQLADTTIIDAGIQASGYIVLQLLEDTDGTDGTAIRSFCNASDEGCQWTGSRQNTSTSPVTSVQLKTSTSTWTANFYVNTYGVKL